MTNSHLFARRTDWPLTTNKFSALLDHLREEKVPVFDLTESNPTKCDFSYLNNEIVSSFNDQENLCYTPSPRGGDQAREAICCYYNEKGYTVSADQVFLTASTSEAYSYLFRLLVNSGERVLFPRPSYPLFTFLGDLNDVNLGTYPLVYNEGWTIDLKGIRQAQKDDTKAIVIVNPNNPTGSYIKRSELADLNALCRDDNKTLICDEVFADFAFDQDKEHVSLIENDQVLTFVLGGISKTLGLPQMKLSWIIVNGPRQLTEKVYARLEMIADTFLSVNTPAQNALPQWLSLRSSIQKEISLRITQNYNFLKEQAQSADNCKLLTTEGGWYAVLKIPDTHSEEEWVLTFLKEGHVAVHPGYFFDFDNEAYVVISLLPSIKTFQEGIRRILQCIKGKKVLGGVKSQTS